MSPNSIKELFSNNRFAFTNTDLVLILDEYDFPALLFNSQSKEIICGNKQFVELSGIGNSELVHMKIDQLLIGKETKIQGEEVLYPMQLLNKNGTRISVSCKLKHIVDDGKTSLMMLFSSTKPSADLPDQQILEEIRLLFTKAMEGKLSEFLDYVVAEVGKLFRNQPIAVYLHDNNLLKNNNSTHIFPESLPVSELERIKDMDFWSPGKRILCEIHRLGRRKGLDGLLTVPLKSNNLKGLIITAVDREDFFISNHEKFEVFFAWIDQLIDLANDISQFQTEIAFLMNHTNALQAFVEHTNDMLLILNGEDIVEHVNKPFLRLMDYSSYEILNHRIYDFIDDDSMKKFLNDAKNNQKREELTVTLYDRGGKKHFMVIQIESLEYEKEIKKLLILTDTTRISQLEKSLMRLEKQSSLGESIADFAHDARNPLNNISTGLQLLRKIYGEDESLAESVDRMQSDCIRMSDLLESVLSFSRQNNEEFTRIELNSLIGNLFRKFENKFEKMNIQTSFKSATPDVYTLGDMRSLERVFINLINNSIESMEKNGGELAILIKDAPQNSHEIEISIADSGPGIPKEILDRIFEPYVSGKKTGTGLGLAIIKKIIDSHKGRIAIESFTSGTIFRIFLNKDLEEIS
jgi:PAS domain S-box-containing protein